MIAWIAACVVAVGALHAQSSTEQDPRGFEVTTWTIANGLPQGTVNDILQTTDGELWVATFGGLLRFDGIEFHTYDLDSLSQLPSIRLTALASDGEEGMWVATQIGHLLHMRDGVVIHQLETPTRYGDIVGLVRDPRGALWVRWNSGALHRVEAGAWREVLPIGSVGTYENLCLDGSGRICAGVRESLVRFDLEGRRLETIPLSSNVQGIAADGPDVTWVGMADGIARIDGSTVTKLVFETPLENGVNVIQPDGSGGLWIGTPKGPRHARPRGSGDTWKLHEVPYGFPAAFSVRALVCDREGNLWVGSFGQGLARMTPHRVQRVQASKTDWMVTAIGVDSDDQVWVGADCLGLLRVHGEPPVATPLELPRFPPRTSCVNAFTFDRLGRLWVSLGHMVLRRDGAEWTTLLDSDGMADSYRPVYADRRGNVWIGTLNGGLVGFGPNDEPLPKRTLPERIVSMSEASDGSLWIGGSTAVYHVTDAGVETFDEKNGLPRGDVRDVLPDADGNVWIATYGGGLGRLVNGQVRRIARENGMPDNTLTRILDDDLGRLWILSNRGLIVVGRAELDSYLQGRIPRVDPVLLGPESGMPEANFGSPAGVRDSRGRLWFGTIACAVRVDPREFPFNRTPPRMRVQRVLADDQEISLEPPVRVPPGTRRVTIEYTAYCMTAPDNVRFRYRLEGFDEHWLDGDTRRRVSFTTLAPGAYTFHLDARNENGVWSDKPVSFDLSVQPSWWQTSAFRFSAIFIGLALVYALDRVRIGVLRRRTQVLLEATRGRALAEERESRLREELAHVARVATAGELATSLAHEVNQPLAAIVANAQAARRYLGNGQFERGEMNTILEEIAQQGQRASEVIRRLREFLRKHEEERRPVDLNTVLRDTLPLLRRELADHGVRVVLELSERSPWVTVDPIQFQQVLVNLIKNACEAMSSTGGERKLILRTETDAEGVRLLVRDTGPGLAPEVRERLFQPYVTTKPAGMGLGLAICRTIVEAHGGRLGVDPTDGRGVTFRIELPAGADKIHEATDDEVNT